MPTFDAHELIAVAQLPAYQVPGYAVPARIDAFSEASLYTQGFEDPAVTVYSQSFESGLDGWTAGTNTAIAEDNSGGISRTGEFGLRMSRSGSTFGVVQGKRTVTGLTVGRAYTFTAWGLNLPAEDVTEVKIGVTGKGYKNTPGLANEGVWTQHVYSFTATATSHELLLEATTASTYVPAQYVAFYWDDITLVRDALIDGWLPEGTGTFAPKILPVIDRAHSGRQSLRTTRTIKAQASARIARREFTSLTVGRTHTFRAWVSAATEGVTVSLGDDSNSISLPASAAPGAWKELVYTFTPTSTTATLGLYASSSVAAMTVFFDDITLVRDAYEVSVPAHTTPATTAPAGPLILKIKSGDITLSDTEAPYVQANLVCAMPTIPQAEAFNPLGTSPLRVTVSTTQMFGDELNDWNAEGFRLPTYRNFNLALRSVKVDRDTQELSLELMSDEALLIDFARVATTPDYTPRTLQSSLRGIVNYCLGKVGGSLAAGADAPVFVAQSPNLLKNPSGRRATTGYSVNGGTMGQDAAADTYVYSTTAGLAGSKYVRMGELVVGTDLEPFTTYTASAYVLHQGQNVLPVLYAEGVAVAGGAAASIHPGGTGFVRHTVTFTTTGTGTAYFTLYNNGSVTAAAYIIAFRDAQVEKGYVASPYFDGYFAADSAYIYGWKGTPDASASIRTLKTPRAEDLLNWMPGVAAWDFLAPIVQTTGFRLWCDEGGVWRLAKEWALENQIHVSPDNGVKRAADTRTRNDRAYWQSVVIKYSWTDSAGVQRVEYDSAGNGNLTWFIERDSPYPGAGAAAFLLSRALGKGRVLDLQATSNYDAVPGSRLIVTLPNTPTQVGVISAVTWSYPSGDMVITSKGLTDTPANAWVLAPPTRTWNAATGTWNTYTN